MKNNNPAKRTIKKGYYQYTPEYGWGGALSGATAGAGVGSSLGVVGTIGGALIGGGLGYFAEENEANSMDSETNKNNVALKNSMYYNAAGAMNPMGQTTQLAAYGGKLYANGGMVPAEVEGGEVVTTPQGYSQKIEGPSHSNGGVQVTAPQGTNVLSDRIKDITTGKTFAEEGSKASAILEKANKIMKLVEEGKVVVPPEMRKSYMIAAANAKKNLDAIYAKQEAYKQQVQSQLQSQAQQRMMSGDNSPIDVPNWVDNPEEQIYKPAQEGVQKFAAGGRFAGVYGSEDGIPPITNGQYYAMEDAAFGDGGFQSIQRVPTIRKEVQAPGQIYDQSFMFGSRDYDANKQESTYWERNNNGEAIHFKPGVIEWEGGDKTLRDVANANPRNQVTAPPIQNIQIPEQNNISTTLTPQSTRLNQMNAQQSEIDTSWLDKNAGKIGSAVSTLGELAPIIYNLAAKKPDNWNVADYMNTNKMNPERQDVNAELSDAERTYMVIINDTTRSAQERTAAANQLQAAKAKIYQYQNNSYKQDINRAQQVNTAIDQSNIQTAMGVRDINDKNNAAAYDMSNAMSDIQKYTSVHKQEANMKSRDAILEKSLSGVFSGLKYDSATKSWVNQDGTVLTPEKQEQIRQAMAGIYAYGQGGIKEQYNPGQWGYVYGATSDYANSNGPQTRTK